MKKPQKGDTRTCAKHTWVYITLLILVVCYFQYNHRSHFELLALKDTNSGEVLQRTCDDDQNLFLSQECCSPSMCEDSVAVVMADIRDLLSDSAASSVERKVLEINAGYSEGASYEFRFYHLTDKQCSHPSGTKRHPAWGKLFAVNHSLFGPSPVKIVLYLDSDAYIHLHTLRVGKPNFPLVLWGDERGPEDLARSSGPRSSPQRTKGKLGLPTLKVCR